MSDDMDTDAIDTETATELHSAAPDAAYEVLLWLARFAKDATAWELRLASDRRRHKAIRSAQKKLNAEKVAFDEYKAKAEAAIEQERKAAARVWAHVKSAENAMAAREEHCREIEREHERDIPSTTVHHPDDDFRPIAGSDMSRSYPAPRTVRHDDLGQEFPKHTSLTRVEG
jgi:hypothetical protein